MLRKLLSSIGTAFISDTTKSELLLQLVSTFSHEISLHFTSDEIVRMFLGIRFRYFFTWLFEIGLINIKSIIDINSRCLFALFAPEIEKYDQKYYEHYVKSNHIEKMVEKIDFSTHKSMRSLGINEGTIAIAIRNDDISLFQDLIAFSNTDLKSEISNSSYERYNYVNRKPSFIEFAAFFRAINIFKFLLQNLNAHDLPKTLAQFAIAGGDYTIIHLCESKYCDFEGCLEVAIQFHRQEIIDYLIDTHGFEYSIDSLCTAVEYNNYESFVDILPHIKDMNEISSSKITSLHYAAIYGYLHFVKLICSLESVDINVKMAIPGMTPLHFAAQAGHLEVVQYLCSIEFIDYNAKDQIGYTPLYYAAQGSFFDVVLFLCSLPGIEIDFDIFLSSSNNEKIQHYFRALQKSSISMSR